MSRPPRRPAPPRHTVAVEIAGEKHVLRSDVPPEYTRAVAAHLDATIRALPGFQTLEPFRAATLAALSITDELFRAREEIKRLRDDASRRADGLAELLEAAEASAAERRPGRRATPPPSAPPPPPAEPAPGASRGPLPPIGPGQSRAAAPELFSAEEQPPPLPSIEDAASEDG